MPPGVCLLLQALLHHPSADLAASSTAGGSQPSDCGSMVVSSAGASLDGSSQAGGRSSSGGAPDGSSSYSSSIFPSSLQLTASLFGAPEPSMSGDRPPSPRTLLASAKAGLELVNSMAAATAGTPRTRTAPASTHAAAPAVKVKPSQQHFFLDESDSSDREQDCQEAADIDSGEAGSSAHAGDKPSTLDAPANSSAHAAGSEPHAAGLDSAQSPSAPPSSTQRTAGLARYGARTFRGPAVAAGGPCKRQMQSKEISCH